MSVIDIDLLLSAPPKEFNDVYNINDDLLEMRDLEAESGYALVRNYTIR